MTTNNEIAFVVPGRPMGKERVAFDPRSGRRFAAVKSVSAEKIIRAEAKRAMGTRPPMARAVAIWIDAIFEIPASWPAGLRRFALDGKLLHTQKPDGDNVEKLVFDALKGLAWFDDSQVAYQCTRKRFGTGARLEVRIRDLSDPAIPLTPSEQRRALPAPGLFASMTNSASRPVRGSGRPGAR